MPELMEGLDAPATSELPAAGSKEYNTWRITGEKPVATVEAPPASPASESGEAAPEAPAAASETAQPEKIETRRQRTERRFNELLSETRDLKRQLAEFAKAKPAEAATAPAAERKAEQSKELSAKLKELDEKWTKGEYQSLAEFNADVSRAVGADLIGQREKQAQTTAKENEFKAARNEVLKRWKVSTDEAKKIHPDFDQVCHDKLKIAPEGLIETALLTSPVGADMFYHLGKNHAELDALNKMNPNEASLALARLELKFTSQSPPEKKTTQAPPPPKVLGSGATAPDDEEVLASKKGDMGRLIEIRNRKDVAAAKSRGRA